ncbi:hypothetical protein KAR91_56455, partial [Candidatus Pacearchaeota archaeon]|nr:hypothetical protein [Candidatus Pacearchaeota archaeon]
FTGSITFVDWAHHKAHEGEKYLSGYSSGDLDDNATIIISFRTGSTSPHVIFSSECSGEAKVTGYENPTVTVSTGSQLAAFNINRRSSNTTTLQEGTTGVYLEGNLAINATIAGGTAIYPTYHFGYGKKVGGGITFSSEYVLNINEDYALTVTSEADDNHCSVQLKWYE